MTLKDKAKQLAQLVVNNLRTSQQEKQLAYASSDVAKHVASRLNLVLDRYVDETLTSLLIDPNERDINRHTQYLPLGLIETIYVDNRPTIAIEVQYPYMDDNNHHMKWDLTVEVKRLT